jgi:Fe2+ or Zn2+ uptake regulation protein
MSLADLKREDRRLLILKALSAESDYSIHDEVIRMLLAEYGHRESIDTVRTDMAWLEEQGLITQVAVAKAIVATATRRGAEVAEGAAVVPGVRRPRPGE